MKTGKSTLVSHKAIRRMATEIAERFHPRRVILFGSYAHGRPTADSDVDILVVMRTRNELDEAVRICSETTHPFALDLIVRTPRDLRWRLREGDWFLREVMATGKVLDEAADGGVGTKGGGRPGRRRHAAHRKAAS